MNWDVEQVAAIIRDTALAEILPRFRQLEPHQIREKGPNNLVTEADMAAERVLTRRLSDLLPGSLVVGEEAAAENPAVLQVLEGDDPVWIIDPVDGTNNFVRHHPVFGVIVALVRQGRTVAGWIHHPLDDRMATAEAGQGAWMNGTRLRTAPAVPLEEMAGSLGYQNAPLRSRVRSLSRAGCVAHDYTELACGRLHFAHYNRLAPWDHAAGVLVVQEAGGHVALMDGSPYRPLPRGSGVLLAPDAPSWRLLRAFFE